MSSASRLVVAPSRARCVTCFGLVGLLLGSLAGRAPAAETVPAPPAEARRAGDVSVQLSVVVAQVRPGLMGSFASLIKPIKGSASVPGQSIFLGCLDSSQREPFLGLLGVLKEAGLAKVLAEPNLIALSGKPASFLSGGEVAVPVPAGRGQVGVQFEEFGVRLNFLPIVLADGRIRLEMEPEASWLGPACTARAQGTEVPGRTTQRLHLCADLKPGQTFLLVPFTRPAAPAKAVGDQGELVLLVTPSLVEDPTRRTPPAEARPEPPGQAEADSGEQVRRLERRLQRMQEEMDDLRRELRSLRRTEAATSGAH